MKKITIITILIFLLSSMFSGCSSSQPKDQTPTPAESSQPISTEAYPMPGTGDQNPQPIPSEAYPAPAEPSTAYPSPQIQTYPTPEQSSQSTPSMTLRMVLLPIIDNLPMYVAQQEGLFAKYGLQVEFIPVASAAERDQVIAAGQGDGIINEIVSTLLYNKDGVQVQIVRLARVPTPESAQYHILVSGKSGITSVAQLKGVPIGVSEGTIIEYITDRLLEAEGLAATDIKTIAVPKIPDRLALLSSGELKAATIPDPLAYLAVQQGATFLVQDSKYPQYGHSTYAFRKQVIDQNPQAIRAFLAAIEDAIMDINADPTRWGELLQEQKLVPEPILNTYQIPPFPTKGVPSEQLWADVLSWAKEKGLVSGDVSYSASVTSEYLP
ncbi:MAG: ABC transporter substrate-binding protein [Anaerolineales bacterium]